MTSHARPARRCGPGQQAVTCQVGLRRRNGSTDDGPIDLPD
jgi:hypothetical protein